MDTVDPSLWAGQVVGVASIVPETGAVGVEVPAAVDDSGPLRLILLRRDGSVRAFVNSCPHARAPLDYPPNKFFDYSGRFLLCSLHGALFRPKDGVCVGGPAQGKALTPVAIEEAPDGTLRIAADTDTG